MEQEESCRPVPAPRRLNAEIRKIDYENVTIDLINKNLNINSENIHTAALLADKLPNNKVLLSALADEESSSDVTSKSILTETNDLYGPNANENVPTTPTLSSIPKPMPAPRPRKPQNNEILLNNTNYENASIEVTSSRSTPTTPTALMPPTSSATLYPKLPTAATSTPTTPTNLQPSPSPSLSQNSTGAISKDTSPNNNKATRRAPELPPKTYLNYERERKRSQRHSITSEVSTTSSTGANAGFYDLNDSGSNSFANSRFQKSVSNGTLNSSIADSNESSDSAKYKSASPGDLLKSLGTTSKLLTEAIGERVALKAKGAKKKLDHNLKTSTEIIQNFSTETSSRLRNVGKRFGNNFTLIKKDNEHVPTQFHVDRPQTLPPNDKVFNTISFSSPLQRKAGGVTDLTTEVTTDNSYEVPKNLKLAKSEMDLIEPPSYEDALKHGSFTSYMPEASDSERDVIVSSVNTSRDSLGRPSPPMPNFPPPALPKEIAKSEGLYGKLNAVQAPVRQKRRKNYEQIQLRRELESPSSLRPNIDSTELHKLNLDAVAAEREESMHLEALNRAAEESTPKPDRSESWEYFEENHEESDCSSPEPLYANQEATYGKVFEMASSNKDLLSPQNLLGSICEEGGDDLTTAGAVGGLVQPTKEVIMEFDPLLKRKAASICRSDKSNQLLLLEYLLEEDTYGGAQNEQSKSDDDVSMSTSEEDNLNSSQGISTAASSSTAAVPKTPPPLTVVLPTPSSIKSNSNVPISPMQIVHQNAQLLSDSMENMLDDSEARVQPFLSRVDEPARASDAVDLGRNTDNRSHWFVQDNRESSAKQRVNPFNKLNIEGGESPPSYLEAIGAEGANKTNTAGHEQKSLTSRFRNSSMNMFTNVRIRVDALKRKSSFKAAQKQGSDVKVTLQMIPRPGLSPLLVRYEGPLIRFPSGVVEDILKEMQNRKAILRDRQFQTFLDQDMKTPKEIIPLEYITTLQCVSNSRVTDNATHFYCFEITTTVPKNASSSSSSSGSLQTMSNPNLVMTSNSSGNCKQQRVSHLYGVGKESERGVWMQKLLESLTNVLPAKYMGNYYRAGWCYLKNSITSEWSGTWLVLKKNQRRLIFVSEASMNVEKMDLRKARCIVLKESDDSINNLHVETGPTLMIDCPPFTVYLIMSSPRETKIWRHIIREVAHNNGFALKDQQLTKFNVPVIVDKCINFVYIHGSMSEGIYRKSGSENSILKLMAAFRADAFNVEITRNEYNEHDVANVLKRFMRDLPERLMGKFSESFMCVTELKSATEKIQIYKELLARLSTIERETLKKIVGHLAFISSQKAKNKMSIKNLTMIWGPTLLQTQAEEMIYSQKEADVLADLITLYKNLFPLTADEMKKEQEMLFCLQKYYAAAETLTDSVKKSGDLKMWITINPNPENTEEEKTQVNVTISPTKTAYEICKELALKMNMSTHQISLHEVILNGNLERPVHHDTKVFDIVLNWSYWPEEDRKNNYLVVKPIDVLREVQRAVKNLAIVTPSKELKFADNRTKSFKTYQCELRDGKIVVSKKDKNEKVTIVREIFLHSAIAYLGWEKKRDMPWSWAITFVERTGTQILRSRESPFIGHVLAGSEYVDRTIWFSSIWYCLYGDNILPPAEIII